MIDFDEDNIYIFSGILPIDSDFVASLGLTPKFFSLSKEVRQLSITAWKELLLSLESEEFVMELSEEVDEDEMAVILSNNIIASREIPDNVVSFRRKDEQGE